MLLVGGGVAFYQSAAAIYPRREALYEAAERSCAEGDQNSCQEVFASIRAARAAEDIVDLGVWQFIAGLIGIYLIGRTLAATRDAVREANDATDAAREAVRVTEQSAQRQLRPYLLGAGATNGWLTKEGTLEETPITGWLFSVNWKNAGQTPALRVKASVNFAFFPAGGPPTGFNYADDPGRPSIVGPVGPGETFHVSFEAPINLLSSCFAGELELHYWSWCDYDDGFPDTPRRRTEKHGFIRFKFDPTSHKSHIADHKVRGFNSVDEDCLHKPKPYE